MRDANGAPVPDTDLRDTESVPVKEDLSDFLKREVLPYVPDAWMDPAKTTVGYEISFMKVFYKYQPPRPLEAILKNIAALEAETEGLLHAIRRTPYEQPDVEIRARAPRPIRRIGTLDYR